MSETSETFEQPVPDHMAGQGETSSHALVVNLEGFEGPLDLLLSLARDQKVDLTKISVLALAEQYLEFIQNAQNLRLEIAADYLVMAAWLAFLKSRLLLPVEENEEEPTAAEMAAADKTAAAIAGALAAERYNLQIVDHNIQDNASNATRFFVLGRKCSPSTKNDRTSLVVGIEDKVGALHQVMAPFRKHRLNMTKIESRPSKRKAWEYLFFIDCDGHLEDKKVANAINELDRISRFIKVLGSYPNAE